MCPTNFGGNQSSIQCSRKATRDGYCGHHHPEAEAKREQRAQGKFQKQLIEERAHKENNIRRWCKDQGYRLVLIESEADLAEQLKTIDEAGDDV